MIPINVSDAFFRWLFLKIVSSYGSKWLFRMTISDAYFTVPDDYFGCLFQMTFPDDDSDITIQDYFGLFWMTIPNDWFAWLYRPEEEKWKWGLNHLLFKRRLRSRPFVIPRPLRISATNLYFHGRFLFQPIIGLPTDWFLNDGFLMQNYGPDPS